jgi:hypothetical protein
MPHWFNASRSENVILEHYGPISIQDLAGENRLIAPISTGKVYVAVAPYVRVFRLSLLEGEAVEVRSLFDQSCVA